MQFQAGLGALQAHVLSVGSSAMREKPVCFRLGLKASESLPFTVLDWNETPYTLA